MKKRLAPYLIFFILVSVFEGCKTAEKTSAPEVKSGKLTEMDRVKFQGTYYNACREKMKGNIEIAETLFSECLKIDPASAPAHYELAGIYRFTGLYDKCLPHAKFAAQSDPKNEWYQLLYIECLHNKRLFNEAIAGYEKLIKTFPDRPDFYESLINECLFAGKPDKAIQNINLLEKKFGRDPELALEKIRILQEQKKFNDAEAEIKVLIREFPGESRFYTYLAEIYQRSGQPQKAFKTYQEILRTDPDNPYIHLALADYYRQQRQDEEFFKELKIAFKSSLLEVDNKIKIMMSYYGITEQYPQYLPQAYELLEILKETHPFEAKTYSIYSDFLYRDKKLKEARDNLIMVISLDKSKYAIWSQLMICESELSYFDDLIKHATEARELFPNQPLPYYFLGISNIRKKKYEDAIEPLREGIEFVYDDLPLLVQFYSNLGEAYNALKSYEKSDKAFSEALKLDPNNALILNNYAYFLANRKEKLDLAEKNVKRALELVPGSVSFSDTYGWVLFQKGEYKTAEEVIAKALKNGGEKRPAILEHYGDVLFKLGRNTDALGYWKKAKEAGGNSEVLEKKIREEKWYE